MCFFFTDLCINVCSVSLVDMTPKLPGAKKNYQVAQKVELNSWRDEITYF